VWGALLPGCVLFPTVAYAGDATLAEALFREGRTLMDAGDFARACPKLQESYAQDPGTGALFALARCHEKSARLASAWTLYSQVASRARAEGRADRERAARERSAALEPRLSKLVIVVPRDVAALSGLIIKRDDQTLAAAAWGSALPADPGEHTVEVSAPGKKPWRQRVVLGKEADLQELVVPSLEAAETSDSKASPPRKAAAPPSPTSPKEEDSSESSGSLLRPIGLVAGGLGLVGIGVGSYFGLKAKHSSDKSKEDGHCDNDTVCDETGKPLANQALSDARISTVLFIAGGALLASGVTLFIVGGEREKDQPSVTLTPSAGPNQATLWLHGEF